MLQAGKREIKIHSCRMLFVKETNVAREKRVSNERVQLHRTLLSHFTHAIATASWHAAKRLNASPYMLLDTMYIRSLLFAIMSPTSLVSWPKIHRFVTNYAHTVQYLDDSEYVTQQMFTWL